MEVSVPCWNKVSPRKKENFRAILCEVLNKTWVCHPFLGIAYALVSMQQSVKAISGLVNNFSSACHS